MRKSIPFNDGWTFVGPDKQKQPITLPHTWNGEDGQDGGNDYYRGACVYQKTFSRPEVAPGEWVYLEFGGVNSSAGVELNGIQVASHNGGYSIFRADITDFLQDENELKVTVNNSINGWIYPQKADFTFYGGIYRDVKLLIVDCSHFDLDYYSGPGARVTSQVDGTDGKIRVDTLISGRGEVRVTLLDGEGKTVAEGEGSSSALTIPNVHLWDGVDDPYLYTAVVSLIRDGVVVDEVSVRFGVRTFWIDPKEGFFLNGRRYPLRGVCRHQDRPHIGNALTKAEHDEDVALIREMGANTIRLAHYQHDQYFYDLCDKYGLIVWAEIPYISEHMPLGRENTFSQMRELITQNYNHPAIIAWGLSNEITISTKDKRDMLDNHRALNELCHELDPTRVTTLACYAMCGPFNKVAHISDVVSWNLYLGWYVPGLFLNDLWMGLFHLFCPKRALGYSEYGAEAMPGLHSSKPRRGDHTEEYQCIYHEYMLRCFDRHPYLWATHVWNMFDFAADARDQGGEPGMNHKGLVTFDRKTKKDAFYLYKAWWSKEPFVHLCSKRYTDRSEAVTAVKVYSNQPRVALYSNGQLVEEQSGDRVFTFRVRLCDKVKLEARAGNLSDVATLRWADIPKTDYQLRKTKSKSANWV